MKTKTKKRLLTVLIVLVLVIGALVGVILFFAAKNKKVMNQTVEKGLDAVKAAYEVTKLDAGEYADMRMYGIMKFHTDQYQVKELGNLSVMTADMGFMQMVSFMITPFEKQVPLCTLDYMYIFGTRKSYVEFYDLDRVYDGAVRAEDTAVLEALRAAVQQYSDIEDITVEPKWYDAFSEVKMHKKLSAKDDARNEEMFLKMLNTYLDESKKLEKSAPEQAAAQFKATQDYANGLIDKGGVSTDVFKKSLGEDKTRDFFARVFFGTALYQ